jgi:hypothetical protein
VERELPRTVLPDHSYPIDDTATLGAASGDGSRPA